ncbi:hypothetical protein L1987_88038 [Smallanthus sonchifolius]|nr:hypothetical protein L1987_88038 [Smallanthus sonchifolius]
MGQGKIASHCAHAATGLYSKLMQRSQMVIFRPLDIGILATGFGMGVFSYVILLLWPLKKSSIDSSR